MSMTGIDYFSVTMMASEIGEITYFSTHKNWFLGLAYVHPFTNQDTP